MLPPDLLIRRGDRLRLKEEWWPAKAGAICIVTAARWTPEHAYFIVTWEHPEQNIAPVSTSKFYAGEEARFERCPECRRLQMEN